jgi:hypothetical protein
LQKSWVFASSYNIAHFNTECNTWNRQCYRRTDYQGQKRDFFRPRVDRRGFLHILNSQLSDNSRNRVICLGLIFRSICGFSAGIAVVCGFVEGEIGRGMKNSAAEIDHFADSWITIDN